MRDVRTTSERRPERQTKYMNQESKTVLSNNNLRRMHGWAPAVYPRDWKDRCAVVVEYLSQLDEETFAALIKKSWPEVFAAAERDWPEAFAEWKSEPPNP
jgi:hypothetical protein